MPWSRICPAAAGVYLHGGIDSADADALGYVTDRNGGTRTVVNALGVGALRSVAEAAGALGDRSTEDVYGDRADKLAAAMREHLREGGTGLWSDGLSTGGALIEHRSEHAQSFPVAYGVAEPSEYAALGAEMSRQGMRRDP